MPRTGQATTNVACRDSRLRRVADALHFADVAGAEDVMRCAVRCEPDRCFYRAAVAAKRREVEVARSVELHRARIPLPGKASDVSHGHQRVPDRGALSVSCTRFDP